MDNAPTVWHGFNGDFDSAVHLLIPQIEHIVRTKIQEIEGITTVYKKDTPETEKALSSLLTHERIDQCFPKETLIELQGLFGSEPGALNLRNTVDHGLYSEEDGIEGYLFHVWQFALKLVKESSSYELPGDK